MEGIGAVALFLRWGTWLSVLADPSKPLHPDAGKERCSAISDSEMKRINLEASAGIEKLLILWKQDRWAFLKLLNKAYAYLPMPQRRVRWDLKLGGMLTFIASQEDEPPVDPGWAAHPFRVLANAITLSAYRNGPIEDVHAGKGMSAGRLLHRRTTVRQEREVIRVAAEKVSGIVGSPSWWDHLPWPEGAGRIFRVPMLYPTGWSLTDGASTIRIPRECA